MIRWDSNCGSLVFDAALLGTNEPHSLSNLSMYKVLFWHLNNKYLKFTVKIKGTKTVVNVS